MGMVRLKKYYKKNYFANNLFFKSDFTIFSKSNPLEYVYNVSMFVPHKYPCLTGQTTTDPMKRLKLW